MSINQSNKNAENLPDSQNIAVLIHTPSHHQFQLNDMMQSRTQPVTPIPQRRSLVASVNNTPSFLTSNYQPGHKAVVEQSVVNNVPQHRQSITVPIDIEQFYRTERSKAVESTRKLQTLNNSRLNNSSYSQNEDYRTSQVNPLNNVNNSTVNVNLDRPNVNNSSVNINLDRPNVNNSMVNINLDQPKPHQYIPISPINPIEVSHQPSPMIHSKRTLQTVANKYKQPLVTPQTIVNHNQPSNIHQEYIFHTIAEVHPPQPVSVDYHRFQEAQLPQNNRPSFSRSLIASNNIIPSQRQITFNQLQSENSPIKEQRLQRSLIQSSHHIPQNPNIIIPNAPSPYHQNISILAAKQQPDQRITIGDNDFQQKYYNINPSAPQNYKRSLRSSNLKPRQSSIAINNQDYNVNDHSQYSSNSKLARHLTTSKHQPISSSVIHDQPHQLVQSVINGSLPLTNAPQVPIHQPIVFHPEEENFSRQIATPSKRQIKSILYVPPPLPVIPESSNKLSNSMADTDLSQGWNEDEKIFKVFKLGPKDKSKQSSNIKKRINTALKQK